MLFIPVAWCLALFAGGVTAHSDSFVSSLALRQVNASATPDCSVPCAQYAEAKSNCSTAHTAHCGCTVSFLQAQGNCLVCPTTTPQDAAAVQFLLDAEIDQCHSEGINVDFQLSLPPAAAAIVDKFNTDSAFLRASQTAFLALQISGGHIGLVIVLAFAVFSRKVRRDSTFLNFCITWIFSSIVFSILLYRGNSGNSTANSLGIVPQNKCLAQAALTTGAQVMTACSTLALVIQLWLGLRTAIHGDHTTRIRQTRWVTVALLAAPYILFFTFALPAVIVGERTVDIAGTTIEKAIPTNFYCSVIEENSFLQANYGVTLGLLLVTVIFDGLIITMLYKHWWAFRHVQTKSAVTLSILLRVILFSVYRIVVAVAYGSVINRPPVISSAGTGATLSVDFSIPIWVDILQAALPLVGFLILGVNSDMVGSLMFWRRFRRGSTQSVQPLNSTSAGTTGVGTMDSAWNEKVILESDTKFVSVPV
ncbi:hypothetical protein JB92DRAFT_3147741 [Gautieria morchelliformis]|nr:hypothetical protein JB92DRAFT_3147741 [Gautieria morchelliformis]